MAVDPKDQQELNKLYNEYIALLQKADRLSYAEAKNKADAAKASNTLAKEVERVNKELTDVVFQTDYIYRSFQEQTSELKNQNNILKIGKSLFTNLTSAAQKLNSFQQGFGDLREKDFKKLKDSLGFQKSENDKIIKDLKDSEGYRKNEIKNLKDAEVEQGQLSTLQRKRLNELIKEEDLYRAAVDAQANGIPILEKELQISKQIYKVREELGGLTKAAAGLLQQYGGSLAQYLDVSEAIEAVDDYNKKVIDNALKQENVLRELKRIEEEKLQLEREVLDAQRIETELLNQIKEKKLEIFKIDQLSTNAQKLATLPLENNLNTLNQKKDLIQNILGSLDLEQDKQDEIIGKINRQISLEQERENIESRSNAILQESVQLRQRLETGLIDANEYEIRSQELQRENEAISIRRRELTGEIVEANRQANEALDVNGNLQTRINNKISEQIDKKRELIGLEEAQQSASQSAKQKEAGLASALNAKEQEAYDIKQAAIKATSTGLTGFINKFKSLGVLVSNLNFTKVFTDPVTLLTTLVNIGFKANAQVVELGKSFGVSADMAENMRQEVASFSRATGDTFVTTERLLKAQSELSKELGIAVKFSNEELATFSKLTELTGLTAQEAGNLAKAAAATGVTTEDYTDSIREGAFAAMQSTNTHFEMKEIMQDISKLSAGTLIKFKGNSTAIAAAVVEAKKLGLTLDQIDKVGESLLNWEQSIENELKAELLTGKELNMERARAAALSGDQLALTQEISSQVGSLEDYQNMNVIAQRSLAEAFGLSREEMAEMLMKQEAINKYGDEAAKLNKEQLEDMERQGLSASEYLQKQEQQRTAQAKFQDAMVKLQDLIGNLVAGPVGQLLDAIADIATVAVNILSIFSPIFDLISGIAEFISDIASTTTGKWVIGLGAAAFLIPKIAGGFVGMFKSIGGIGDKIKDVFSPETGKGFFENLFGGFKKTESLTGKVAETAKETITEKATGGLTETVTEKGQELVEGKVESITGGEDLAGKAEGVTEGGEKVSKGGDGEDLKKKLQNIAEGLKSFANKDVLLGALNLIPTSIGLTAMIPGAIGAKLISLVDGEKLKKALEGMAEGIKVFGDNNLFKGIGNLIFASVGLTAMIPGAIGAKLISIVDGDAFKKSMEGIAAGIISFGNNNLFKGALNLIVASAGLILMIPGAIGAKLISLVDGEKFEESMYGMAYGIEAFGTTAVLKGSAAMILASIGLTAMIPGAIGAKLISLVDGEKFEESIKGIARGIEAFGTGKVFAGSASMVLAAVGLTAMIPGAIGAKLVSLVDGEKFEESMYGLAYGIESFASGKVAAGSLVMVLAGIGLLALSPGALAIGLVARMVDGEKIENTLTSLGKGINGFISNISFGNIIKAALAIALLGASLIPAAYAFTMFGDVEWEDIAKAGVALGGLVAIGYALGKASDSMLKGAGAIALLGLSLIPTAMALQMFADISWEDMAKAGVALVGLGVAGAVFGSFMPLMLAGALAIGALGTALIPFALALNIMAPALEKFTPLVEAFGDVISKVFGGIATVVTAAANGIATIFGSLQDVDVVKLLAIGPALMGVGAGLAALGAGNVIDAIGSFFAGDPAEKIAAIAESGKGLSETSTALQNISTAVSQLNSSLASLDVSKLFFIGPALMMIGEGLKSLSGGGIGDALGSLLTGDPIEKLERLATIGDRLKDLPSVFQTVVSSITQLNTSLASLDVSKLDAIGPAITKIGIGLASLGVGNTIDSISSLFAGDPIEKLERLAFIGDKLQTTVNALQSTTSSISQLNTSLISLDVSKLDAIGPAITKIGIGLASLGGGNIVDAISSLLAGDPIEKLERLAATSDGLQTASSALQSIAIALMEVSSALTTIDISKLEALDEFASNRSTESAVEGVANFISAPIKAVGEMIGGGEDKEQTINAGGIDLTPMINAINEVRTAVNSLQSRPVKLYIDSREITARQLQANNSI